MPEPKYAKGTLVRVSNRDPRNLVWYPKFETLHGKTGTVVESEYWSTYYLPGDDHPTDVFNYTVNFGGTEQTNIPQMILEPVDQPH